MEQIGKSSFYLKNNTEHAYNDIRLQSQINLYKLIDMVYVHTISNLNDIKQI